MPHCKVCLQLQTCTENINLAYCISHKYFPILPFQSTLHEFHPHSSLLLWLQYHKVDQHCWSMIWFISVKTNGVPILWGYVSSLLGVVSCFMYAGYEVSGPFWVVSLIFTKAVHLETVETKDWKVWATGLWSMYLHTLSLWITSSLKERTEIHPVSSYLYTWDEGAEQFAGGGIRMERMVEG